MDEKLHVYNTEVVSLPPLRLVIDDIPSPDPNLLNKSNRQSRKSGRHIEVTVKRIIDHLEKD